MSCRSDSQEMLKTLVVNIFVLQLIYRTNLFAKKSGITTDVDSMCVSVEKWMPYVKC